MFIEQSPGARHYFKFFMWINSFIPHVSAL